MEPGMKLTMLPEESPSQQVTRDANAEFVVVDSASRRITIKDPGFLAQFKLVQLVGKDTAQNAVYMNMAFPLMYIVAIDGDRISRPTTQLELDALIQRAGQHGHAAVLDGISEHFYSEDDQQLKDEAVKN